jgi:hypothetical protein
MEQENHRPNLLAAVPQSGNANSMLTTRVASSTDKDSGIEALFSLCGVNHQPRAKATRGATMSIDEEIGYFVSSIDLADGTDFARFWSSHEKRLPIMSAVVRRIMNIPATSVPCRHVPVSVRTLIY